MSQSNIIKREQAVYFGEELQGVIGLSAGDAIYQFEYHIFWARGGNGSYILQSYRRTLIHPTDEFKYLLLQRKQFVSHRFQ